MSHSRVHRRVTEYTHEKVAIRSPWSHESVIEAFQEFERDHGEQPKCGDLGKHGLPWLRTVQRLFGSLPAAHKAAGLPPRHVGRPRRAA